MLNAKVKISLLSSRSNAESLLFPFAKAKLPKNARGECIAVYRECRNATRRSPPVRLVYQKVSYNSNAKSTWEMIQTEEQ